MFCKTIALFLKTSPQGTWTKSIKSINVKRILFSSTEPRDSKAVGYLNAAHVSVYSITIVSSLNPSGIQHVKYGLGVREKMPWWGCFVSKWARLTSILILFYRQFGWQLGGSVKGIMSFSYWYVHTKHLTSSNTDCNMLTTGLFNFSS